MSVRKYITACMLNAAVEAAEQHEYALAPDWLEKTEQVLECSLLYREQQAATSRPREIK